jgi:hypothetical protein
LVIVVVCLAAILVPILVKFTWLFVMA